MAPKGVLLPYLRLLRVGTLFSPAADVIAGACLAAAAAGGAAAAGDAAVAPWSVDVARGAGASVLIYAAGMVLNDHADRRADATHRPERPIPAGQITAPRAAALGIVLLLGGVLLAPVPLYWLALAGGVVFYDYGAKRGAAAGAVTMGLLRAANLIAGGVAATGAFAPDPATVYAASAYGLYIVAVTILGIFEDQPTVAPRAVVAVQTVPPLVATLAVLALPQRWPALAVAVVLALAFSLRVRRQGADWNQRAIRGSMTWLLLGTMLYTSVLCLGTGRWPEAVGIVLAALAARRISRTIALT